MRNTISSRTGELVLTNIIVTFSKNGTYSAAAHQGWFVPDSDDTRQVEVFKRGIHRIKLVTRGGHVENIREWGAWLCAALIDENEQVWRHVDLSEYDRKR